MYVDSQTLAELEILHSRGGNRSLAQVIDRTRTRLGASKLRQRLSRPIANPKLLRRAHHAYAALHDLTLGTDLDLDQILDGSTVDAVERYLDSNLSTVADRGLLSGTIEAGWIALRYPELLAQARAGIDDARRLITQLGALLGLLRDRPLEGELARVTAGIGALLEKLSLEALVAGARAWQVLAADHALRIRHRGDLKRLLDLVGELDLILASAILLREGFVVPEIAEGEPEGDEASGARARALGVGNGVSGAGAAWRIEGEGIWHPFLERAVTNPFTLSAEANVLFLTGPNMAGKTTYIRAVAICLFLAQASLPVPAARFCFHPVEAFYTALTDEDDLRQGISSFMADLLRVRKVLERVRRGERIFAIFDELFRGTNTTDSAECLETFLEGVTRFTSSGFVISSHLAEVAERFAERSGLRTCHFAAEWDGKEASFNYTLRPGTSSQRLGRLLFRREGLDELLL